MSSGFVEGELCGVRAVLSVLEHEPGISVDDLKGRLRCMIDQLGVGLSDDARRSYLLNDKEDDDNE